MAYSFILRIADSSLSFQDASRVEIILVIHLSFGQARFVDLNIPYSLMVDKSLFLKT